MEEYKLQEKLFTQKKVKHIFHYTPRFDYLRKIIKNDFIASYCDETIGNLNYLIPMVSFCNIPLSDVSKYMFYGKYGIGLSLEWAIKNDISPVIYIHENSKHKTFPVRLFELNKIRFDNRVNNYGNHNSQTLDKITTQDELSELKDIYESLFQLYKSWKVKYRGKEIITYQEREWRYIPENIDEKFIPEDSNGYLEWKNKKKPHFGNSPLRITSIEDIRYIIVRKEHQRNEVMKILSNKFGISNCNNSILSGKLNILTQESIYNDF